MFEKSTINLNSLKTIFKYQFYIKNIFNEALDITLTFILS